MKTAVITNQAPPYRVPLYRLLAEEIGAEFFLLEPPPFTYYEQQGAANQSSYRFPYRVLKTERESWSVASSPVYDCVISAISGRLSLPLAYLGARWAKKPFVLWASMWSHPRSLFHRVSAVPTRYLYRHSDGVVTYGPHVSRYVKQFRDRGGVFEATQAVDSSLFMRNVTKEELDGFRQLHGLGGGPCFLFVGRIAEDKGVRYLIEAWSSYFEGERSGRLLLVGDGPLKSWAASHEGVLAAGHLEQQQLPAAYAAAVALLLPSIRTDLSHETWGLVANEAMSQGTPVIASDSVGAVAGGLVRDRENGLVVPERDSAALAEAFRLVGGNPELSRSLGQRARRDVSGYTIERMATAFKDVVAYATNL